LKEEFYDDNGGFNSLISFAMNMCINIDLNERKTAEDILQTLPCFTGLSQYYINPSNSS